MPTINSCCNITNQHNCVEADDFRPRILHKFIYIHFVGTSLAAVRYRQYPMQSFNRYNLPSTIASYYNQTFILPAFQHFLFIQKSKRLQKKSKLCPQEGKQAPLKSKSFCAMLRKNRLKCESISARLFLACHQKFNAFKCKQFCCAKPTLAHLLAGGFAPRPPQRRAAVHRLLFSIGSSAHSPANALELERVRTRAACYASRPLAPLKSLQTLRRDYWKLNYKSRLGHLLLLCKSSKNEACLPV